MQVCMLSSEIGFKLGPTLLAGFPLHRDPNITTAIPSSTTYKQQRMQISGCVEKRSAWTRMTQWVIFKIYVARRVNRGAWGGGLVVSSEVQILY